MLMDLPLVIDLHHLHDLRKAHVDERLLRANKERIPHEYVVNESVYVRTNYSSSDKAKPMFKGPFPIVQVHTNNTVTLRTAP